MSERASCSTGWISSGSPLAVSRSALDGGPPLTKEEQEAWIYRGEWPKDPAGKPRVFRAKLPASLPSGAASSEIPPQHQILNTEMAEIRQQSDGAGIAARPWALNNKFRPLAHLRFGPLPQGPPKSPVEIEVRERDSRRRWREYAQKIREDQRGSSSLLRNALNLEAPGQSGWCSRTSD